MLEAGPLNVQSNTALLQRPVLLSVPRKNISVSHSRVVEIPMRPPRLDGYRYFLRFSARLPDRWQVGFAAAAIGRAGLGCRFRFPKPAADPSHFLSSSNELSHVFWSTWVHPTNVTISTDMKLTVCLCRVPFQYVTHARIRRHQLSWKNGSLDTIYRESLMKFSLSTLRRCMRGIWWEKL